MTTKSGSVYRYGIITVTYASRPLPCPQCARRGFSQCEEGVGVAPHIESVMSLIGWCIRISPTTSRLLSARILRTFPLSSHCLLHRLFSFIAFFLAFLFPPHLCLYFSPCLSPSNGAT